ncbi:DUF2937 family protein [Sinimarinibacterium sp. CAU 1509]|uniref:DUF2937 family protein n=1 Tax=Sinimarinibacterium sp. CAU 1509 TaxID=2562283 RepID=UPI0010AD115C|nr:DUF2937 family protein [Sinimarinibacterium sp. CAU 1509]TJY61075.1 DUF2937 family protein [Sinimarinibacterium sp. CAU 1509]
MNLITGLLDRLLFTAGLLVFLQIPQFVDHYTQRYAGYHQAVADSVAEYQLSADAHYDGDLGLMIHDFNSDDKAAMRDMGGKMERDRDRLQRMTAGLTVLRGSSLIDKLVFLGEDLDRDIARATLEDFTPGLPLSSDALICGLIGGITVSGLLNILLWIGRQLGTRRPPRLRTTTPPPPPASN